LATALSGRGHGEGHEARFIVIDGGLPDLDAIRRALMQRLNEDAASFTLLNTRLILRTGVSLSQINPRNSSNPQLVARVLAALGDMGFSLQAPAKKG
jgi:hypothetical protein